MINTLEVYSDAGRKSAVARNNNDESTALHWHMFYVRMRNVEHVKDRLAAACAYENAYQEARRAVMKRWG